MSTAHFTAYPSKFSVENKNGVKGSSKKIQMLFSEITISDQDLALLKNLDPELHVRVMVKSEDELSLAEIEELREKNLKENYNVV